MKCFMLKARLGYLTSDIIRDQRLRDDVLAIVMVVYDVVRLLDNTCIVIAYPSSVQPTQAPLTGKRCASSFLSARVEFKNGWRRLYGRKMGCLLKAYILTAASLCMTLHTTIPS